MSVLSVTGRDRSAAPTRAPCQTQFVTSSEKAALWGLLSGTIPPCYLTPLIRAPAASSMADTLAARRAATEPKDGARV